MVAQVLGLEEWSALHSLSQQLARRHRLVRARGEVEVAGRYLSPYQFGHALFQHYLYQQLDPGERRRLHGEVARVLEALYGGQADEIAAQLARHFQEARRPDKAVEYLRRLSPTWRVYGGVEGTQDEVELITEAQWHLSPAMFLKLNSSFGLTSKATDWAPEVGIMFAF